MLLDEDLVHPPADFYADRTVLAAFEAYLMDEGTIQQRQGIGIDPGGIDHPPLPFDRHGKLPRPLRRFDTDLPWVAVHADLNGHLSDSRRPRSAQRESRPDNGGWRAFPGPFFSAHKAAAIAAISAM